MIVVSILAFETSHVQGLTCVLSASEAIGEKRGAIRAASRRLVHGLGSIAHAGVIDNLESSSASKASSASATGLTNRRANSAIGSV